LLEQSTELNPLIFCYGLLSAYLHLQRLPREIRKQDRFVRQIAVGEAHCLILMGEGSLYGVGSNEFGQLGMSSKQAEDQGSIFVEQLTLIELLPRKSSLAKMSAEVPPLLKVA